MMNTQAKTFVRSQLFPEEMPQFLERKKQVRIWGEHSIPFTSHLVMAEQVPCSHGNFREYATRILIPLLITTSWH